MSELRVFIADDEAPARERLKELLADLAGELPTRIVGEARNGIEVMEGFPASGAQVLLLDIAMPGMGGLETARHLARLPGAPAVVFVTAHDEHAIGCIQGSGQRAGADEDDVQVRHRQERQNFELIVLNE